MKRRIISRVSTGSMADIAFLLLVFWMMTTSLQSEQGILRKLPPIEKSDTVLIPDKDILDIYINADDQLLINESTIELSDIYANAITFFTNGGVFSDSQVNESFTERKWMRKSALQNELDKLAKTVQFDKSKEHLNKRIAKIEKQLVAIGYFGEYKALKPSSLISIQHHHLTSYDTYLFVQNELQRALNSLRNELAIEHFGKSYEKLDPLDQQMEITAIRQVFPQKISEAEFKR
ncbi:MAG: biopolymer transporter ExbD [Bacteroidota bacterium]